MVTDFTLHAHGKCDDKTRVGKSLLTFLDVAHFSAEHKSSSNFPSSSAFISAKFVSTSLQTEQEI